MAIGRVTIIALGIGVASGAALAAQAPPPPVKERKICRESEPRPGSHIRTLRQCRTAEQWRQEDAEKTRVPPSLTITEGQNDGRAVQQPQ